MQHPVLAGQCSLVMQVAALLALSSTVWLEGVTSFCHLVMQHQVHAKHVYVSQKHAGTGCMEEAGQVPLRQCHSLTVRRRSGDIPSVLERHCPAELSALSPLQQQMVCLGRACESLLRCCCWEWQLE
jgi:hypothetical protein